MFLVMSFRFPNKGFFAFLSVFIRNLIKNSQINFFGNIIFLHKDCFACLLVFWYVKSSKTLKGNFLVEVGFILMYCDCPGFSVLLTNTLKNTQRTLFW